MLLRLRRMDDEQCKQIRLLPGEQAANVPSKWRIFKAGSACISGSDGETINYRAISSFSVFPKINAPWFIHTQQEDGCTFDRAAITENIVPWHYWFPCLLFFGKKLATLTIRYDSQQGHSSQCSFITIIANDLLTQKFHSVWIIQRPSTSTFWVDTQKVVWLPTRVRNQCQSVVSETKNVRIWSSFENSDIGCVEILSDDFAVRHPIGIHINQQSSQQQAQISLGITKFLLIESCFLSRNPIIELNDEVAPSFQIPVLPKADFPGNIFCRPKWAWNVIQPWKFFSEVCEAVVSRNTLEWE